MTSPLLDIHAEHLIIIDAQERLKPLVVAARKGGYSWAAIGEMLELDPDDVRELYAPTVRAAAYAETVQANASA